MNINICKDYTDTPGGRYISQGEFSGEDFRNKDLDEDYKQALEIIQIKSNDEPSLIEDITKYIKDAIAKK